jgi:excisionase family DNA binding protein
MERQDLGAETVYVRLSRETTALAEDLLRSDLSAAEAAKHAGWIIDHFDLSLLPRFLDVETIGLFQRLDRNTGEFVVELGDQLPRSPDRNNALVAIARILDGVASRVPSDPPVFGQVAADLRAAIDALRFAVRLSYSPDTAAKGDKKREAEMGFIVTVTQAADYLGISKGTVTKWVATGKLKARGSGRSRRIHIGSMHELRSKRMPTVLGRESDESVRRKFDKVDRHQKGD